MRNAGLFAILTVALVIVISQGTRAHADPMGTVFTYQGRLIDGNDVADGLYDLQFKIFDSNVGGSQVGSSAYIADLDIIDGYFTVELDFGSSAFTGDARWLEIGVRAGELEDPNTYSILDPRQEVTPTPYAIFAANAEDADTLDGYDSSDFMQASADYGRSGVSSTLYEGTTPLSNKYLGISAMATNSDKLDGYHASSFTLTSQDYGRSGVSSTLYEGTTALANKYLGISATATNADRVDGYHAGNGSGYVPISNGSLCSNLNADKLDGYHASSFTQVTQDYGRSGVSSTLYEGTTALSSKYLGISATAANSDKVDGLHESAFFQLAQNETVSGRPYFYGGTSGSTPPFYVDSTYLVSGLNADYLDGYTSASFSLSNHWHASLNASDGSPTNALFVDPDGEVGIALTSPGHELDIRPATDNDAWVRVTGTSPDGYAGLYIGRYAGSANGYIVYKTAGTEYWYVGQIKPTYDYSISTSYSAPDGKFYLTQAGNLGIGTTSPQEKLHVAGDIRLNAGGDIAFADDNTRIHESGDDLYIEADDDLYLSPDDDIYMDSSTLFVDGSANRVAINTTAGTSNEKLFVYRASGDTGADRSSIYGYRYGSSAGAAYGGIGWSEGGVDAAIKGYSFYGNNYTAGVAGYNFCDYAESAGVIGGTSSASTRGMLAYKDASGNLYAGYFVGNAKVTGTLTKGGGSFQIDHPLDPENKYLYHSFVESPDMKNIYDGIVQLDKNGEATVVLPDWFEALNRDFRYQLTAIGMPGPNLYIADKISDNRFIIAGGEPGMEVSWQVTGIRHDPFAEANRIQVEVDKSPEEQGTYLHPDAYGVSEELGLHTQMTLESTEKEPGDEFVPAENVEPAEDIDPTEEVVIPQDDKNSSGEIVQ